MKLYRSIAVLGIFLIVGLYINAIQPRSVKNASADEAATATVTDTSSPTDTTAPTNTGSPTDITSPTNTGAPTDTVVPTDTGAPTGQPTATPTCIPLPLCAYDHPACELAFPIGTYCPVENNLLVKVIVDNTQGGSAKAGDFTVFVKDSNSGATLDQFFGDQAGTGVYIDSGVLYSVSEGTPLPDGYTLTFSGDCSGQINPGDLKECTLTDTYIAPTATPTGTVEPTATVTPTPTIDMSNCTPITVYLNGTAVVVCQQQLQYQSQSINFNPVINNNPSNTNNNNNANNNNINVNANGQVLGAVYSPSNATKLPGTGTPTIIWEVLGGITPLGFILRKISGK